MSSVLIPILIAVLVFMTIVYFLLRSSGEENIRSRLDQLQPGFDPNSYGQESAQNPETAFLNKENQKSACAYVGEKLVRLTGKDVETAGRELRLPFVQAGVETPNALGNYYLFRAVALPVSLIVAYFLLSSDATGLQKLLSVASAIAIVTFAWYGPKTYLTNNKQKRQKTLQRSFPDTLDLVLVCVESGLALDAALARVCRELGRAHPEITKELNRTRMELTLLSDRLIALQNLAERTDLVAFRSLVAALLQTEKFGTSLTETLRVLSEDYRHTRLMMAEAKAGKLPAMMTIPLITLLLPAIFLVIMGPAVLSLMDAFKG